MTCIDRDYFTFWVNIFLMNKEKPKIFNPMWMLGMFLEKWGSKIHIKWENETTWTNWLLEKVHHGQNILE